MQCSWRLSFGLVLAKGALELLETFLLGKVEERWVESLRNAVKIVLAPSERDFDPGDFECDAQRVC